MKGSIISSFGLFPKKEVSQYTGSHPEKNRSFPQVQNAIIMFPVLQPSMTDLESRAENSYVVDGKRNEQLQEDRFFKKNETAIANGPATIPVPPILHHIQSRFRCYFLSYRRHRHFRRFLWILWGLAILTSISANWLAWTGNSLMESLAIVTTAPVEVCFITAQYASSAEQLDNLVNLRQEAPNLFSDSRFSDHFHFFAFTNQRDWIEKQSSANKQKKPKKENGGKSINKDNGWTILVKEFPPETFRRFITQSRWPKFQGFRHEQIQKACDVAFYMDGTVRPVGSPWKFQIEARRILDSEVQLSQVLHPHADEDGGGIVGEVARCRKKKKDLESNLQKTMEWLEAQPDFTNDCTMYQNTFFGYAVKSPSFQKAADFAWGHFSLEKDSWRDQPLWCYTLQHLGISPLIIPGNLMEYQGERRPANKHTYGEEATNNAKIYYEKNANTRLETKTEASTPNTIGSIYDKKDGQQIATAS